MAAPDRLEPYAATLHFRARGQPVAPRELVAGLLEDVARRCQEAGCSLIGHIKCHATTAGAAWSCSLTSLATGAVCRGEVHGSLAPGQAVEVDLAVLVYGVDGAVVSTLVDHALLASADATHGDWHVVTGGGHHRHT